MRPLTIAEYEGLARERLHLAVWDYYSAGVDDELALAMTLAGSHAGQYGWGAHSTRLTLDINADGDTLAHAGILMTGRSMCLVMWPRRAHSPQ